MFPRAGGIYHFLKEAYGPLWGFLFGWACFLVIMSGGIAAIAVGFGEYLGELPAVLLHVATSSSPCPSASWSLDAHRRPGRRRGRRSSSSPRVNHFGLKEGARSQNALTVLKIGAIAAFVVLGFARPAVPPPLAYGAPLPPLARSPDSASR